MQITAQCVPSTTWEPPVRQWDPPTEPEFQPLLPLSESDQPSLLDFAEDPSAPKTSTRTTTGSTPSSSTLKRTSRHPSPRVTEVSSRFAHLIVESLQGARRPAGLVDHFEPQALATLTTRCAQPLRQAKVASLRLQAVRADSAEVTVRVSTSERDIAIAMRIGIVQGRWKCLALLIG